MKKNCQFSFCQNMFTFNIQKSVILIKIGLKYYIARVRYKGFKVISKSPVKTAVNLSYKVYGENYGSDEPPIMLFHGLLGNKKHWDSIGKTMMNVTKRAVVSVDLRNHGDSPHANSHKYEDLAADIIKLLEKLSIGKASLVGHSMGGRAAMITSLLAPEKISRLLIIDISPISTTSHLTQYLPDVLEAMKKVSFKKQKNVTKAKHEAKKQLENVIHNNLLMKAVLSNVKVKADRSIGWACNVDVLLKHIKYIASFPKDMEVKKYYGPTLFIGGQLSEYLPPDDLLGIRELFPRAVITYVPRVGHNVHVEDPKTFLELAIAFLRNNK